MWNYCDVTSLCDLCFYYYYSTSQLKSFSTMFQTLNQARLLICRIKIVMGSPLNNFYRFVIPLSLFCRVWTYFEVGFSFIVFDMPFVDCCQQKVYFYLTARSVFYLTRMVSFILYVMKTNKPALVFSAETLDPKVNVTNFL